MANRWIEALKKWNKDRDTWCLPKKGTKEYMEVRKIMEGGGEGKKTKTRVVEVKKTRGDEYYDDLRPRRGKKTITYF